MHSITLKMLPSTILFCSVDFYKNKITRQKNKNVLKKHTKNKVNLYIVTLKYFLYQKKSNITQKNSNFQTTILLKKKK